LPKYLGYVAGRVTNVLASKKSIILSAGNMPEYKFPFEWQVKTANNSGKTRLIFN